MANDPVIIATPKDVWTKVATAVTAGRVWIKNTRPNYLQTYRVTGGGAPTDLSEAVDLTDGALISSVDPIDVYVYSEGDDGSVRLDT